LKSGKKKEVKKKKRKVDLLVISDVHLGTYGCHAKELVKYMQSIKPKTVVINGDFIDVWQFNKRYWPKAHMQVIHRLTKWMSKGVKIHYITGNHDELLRKFNGFKLGSLSISNKLLLELDGKKVWIFHGDVFDVTMQHSKWLAKLGSTGYDLLILINTLCNWVSAKMGRGKLSFSKKIKNSVKSAVKYINDFEKTTAEIAIANGYDYVLCGHIHHPEFKTVTTGSGSVQYLNSGDWIENLTAIEYHQGEWKIFHYDEKEFMHDEQEQDGKIIEMKNSEIFSEMLNEFASLSGEKNLKSL
jgi:UDP-2,3-diacylglucosamine pyrophosphatase LpxH